MDEQVERVDFRRTKLRKENATQERTAPTLVWIVLTAYFTYAWIEPFSVAYGFFFPGVFRTAALGIFILSTLVLSIHTRHNPLPPAVLWVFILPMSLMALADMANGDTRHLVFLAINLAALVSLSRVPSNILSRHTLLFLSAVLVGSLVVAQLIPAGNLPTRDFIPLFIDGRATGLPGHPNSLGIVAAMTILIAIFKGARWYFLALAIFTLGASASQTSTAAITAALLIGLAVRSFFREPSKLNQFLYIVGIGVVLAVGIFAAWRMQIGDAFSDNTFTGRTEIWAALSRSEPGFWGLSKENFLAVTREAKGVNSAHNMYMQLRYLYGVPGAIGFIGSLAAMVFFTFRQKLPALSAFAVYYIILGLGEGVLWSTPLSLLLPLVMVAVLPKDGPRLPRTSRLAKRKIRVGTDIVPIMQRSSRSL